MGQAAGNGPVMGPYGPNPKQPVVSGPSNPIGPGVPTQPTGPAPTGPSPYNPPQIPVGAGGPDQAPPGPVQTPIGPPQNPYKPGPQLGNQPYRPWNPGVSGINPQPARQGVATTPMPGKRFPPIR